MLIFLRTTAQANAVITTPNAAITLDYATVFPRINHNRAIVPWYSIDADPLAFGRRLLGIAAADPVCSAVLARATATWGVDFAIDVDAFRTIEVQRKFEKQLKIWLSPLSGNLGHRNAHRSDVDEQYARLWQRYALDQGTLRGLAASDFFRSLNVAGRRDRIQIYRNVTEAARALVGEVTSWPSRAIEKMAVLGLLRSPGLAAMQRQLLAAVARAIAGGQAITAPMWEYLPYYLRGQPLEVALDDVARPRVLGALHDCINDEADTRADANAGHIAAFRNLAGGAEYRRWRMLPAVVRYQVLLSDLARILPGGKQEAHHQRVQFAALTLANLPTLDGYGAWPTTMEAHALATPHNPGNDFPFAPGWTRNEYCRNVVSCRLMLAPLYAGTSGHNQGRILAWRTIAGAVGGLGAIPIGLVMSAGYSVLWRLYYDKRVSGFHTLFETFQGSHVDVTDYNLGAIGRVAGDDVWNSVLDCSDTGRTNVRALWLACIARAGARGASLSRQLEAGLAQARQAALTACPGAVIPRWNATGDVNRTGTEVDVWAPEQNQAILREYEAWLELVRDPPVPRPLGVVGPNALVVVAQQAPVLLDAERLQIQGDIARLIGVDRFSGDDAMSKLFKRWLVTNASDKTTDEQEKRRRDEQVQLIRSLFDRLKAGSQTTQRLTGPSAVLAIAHQPDELHE